jgi:hypothetical protein
MIITCFVFFFAACKIALKSLQLPEVGVVGTNIIHIRLQPCDTYEQNEVCSVGFEVSHLYLENVH